MTYSPTAFQFTHLLQRVYDRLEQTKTLTATGGSTTTVIDTSINADIQDDTYNGYTLFVNYDAGGAGAAPEGDIRTVSDYVQSTTTLTVAAFSSSSSVAAGDIIVLARKSLYPLADVKRLCSNALKKLGDIPVPDTSLTTAANQTEYDIPSGVRWDDIVSVEIQGNTSDSNDNRYYPVSFRVVSPTTPGGTATLVLDQHSSGRTIRITSVRPHANLRDYDDDINGAIHEELAVAACALECAKWQRQASADMLPTLQSDFALAFQLHPVPRFVKQVPGMPHWSNKRSYPGDQSIFDR